MAVILTIGLPVTGGLRGAATAQSNSARELVGLWEAKRRPGPDIGGTLLITHDSHGWWAEIAGHNAPVMLENDRIWFDLADGNGSFKGSFSMRRTQIVGDWVEQRNVASPVTLNQFGRNTWRGTVLPFAGTLTLYLAIKARDNGSVGAFLRNPERNIGLYQYPIDQIERDRDSVTLFAANKDGKKGSELAQGKFDAQRQVLSVYLPDRGGTFDFRRLTADETSDFYPRGRPTAKYVYRPPLNFDDGWRTASVEDVGISRDGIQKFIQMIVDTPMDSATAPEIHGVLIARHGKLVVEEYFHGEHREKAHDTRSAAKSLASDLAGAAIYSGVPLSPSSYVYQVMNGGAFPAGLEPRKRALTFHHLLTMSSGLDCDEEDENSAGYEDKLHEQTEQPDYYKFMLNLKMVLDPGTKAVYCSGGANLVAGMVVNAARQSSPVLFKKLIANPLQIKRYYMALTPTGEYYAAGGAYFLPRDFMKIGQVHVNGGTWNGRRIFTSEWSHLATSPLTRLAGAKRTRYGYLWWVIDYPYKGRTIQAYFASGNGGQEVIGIPELDLVVATYAGNYNDWETGVKFLIDYMPKYILPAIDK